MRTNRRRAAHAYYLYILCSEYLFDYVRLMFFIFLLSEYQRIVISSSVFFVLQSLDKSPSSKPVENAVILKAPNATDIAGQRMDSYRFSMANLEGKSTKSLLQYV